MQCLETAMKAAAIPAVRVPPELRRAAEELLVEGETLSAFVDGAARHNVEYRREQTELSARGLAARGAAGASGRHVKAAIVLSKLERCLKVARKKVVVKQSFPSPAPAAWRCSRSARSAA
jgi:hypothetical protein